MSTALYITCVLIAFKTYSKAEHYKIELNYEFENWEQPVISDVQISTVPCSSVGLKTWSYSWPGSKISCDCRLSDRFSLSKSNLQAKVYWRKCSADMTKCSCKESKSQAPVSVDDFFIGQRKAKGYLCLVTNEHVTFRKTISNVNKDGTCDEDSRLCPDLPAIEDDSL